LTAQASFHPPRFNYPITKLPNYKIESFNSKCFPPLDGRPACGLLGFFFFYCLVTDGDRDLRAALLECRVVAFVLLNRDVALAGYQKCVVSILLYFNDRLPSIARELLPVVLDEFGWKHIVV